MTTPADSRELSERQRAHEEEAEIQAMFDLAWVTLSPEEREAERSERAAWQAAYAGNPKAVTP